MNELAQMCEGEPKVTMTTDAGRTTITVALRHLRPVDAEGADVTGSFLAFASVGLAGWLGYEAMEITGPAIGFFLGGLWGRPLIQQGMREVAQVTATVQFTEDSIMVQRAPGPYSLELEGPWQKFNRGHDHRFVLLQHDKARAEKDEIDFQIRNRPGNRVTRYYGESFYVALDYLGQRYDIAEVMGQRRANAILDRLTFCDSYMDGLMKARKGMTLRPQDEWSGPPSSIPR